MARYRRNRSKPWLATVRKFREREEFIGYFATKEEAECAEYDYGRRLSSFDYEDRRERRCS